MKPWIKWSIAGVVVALLAAGTLRTLSARQAKRATLETQQIAQKTQVAIQLMPTDLVQVKMLDLPHNIAVSGSVNAAQTALVKARIAGELQGLTVREGDSVKAGQVLGRIDPTESEARLRQAQQQAQAAKAQVDIAQRSHDNNVALVAQGFISSTALAASQATLAAAQATHAAAQSAADIAVKSLNDTVLHAPIAGHIAQRLAQTGERVAIDTRIVEIIDLNHLELESALSPEDALQVRVGQKAMLRVEGSTQPISASVARINPSASAGSRAVPVYLTIAAGSALRRGLFLEGTISTRTLHTLAVPLSAVRTDKPKPYVQLVRDKQVQHVNVEMGMRSQIDEQTMVSVKGLPEGSIVIAGTVGLLRPGASVNVTVPEQGAR
ncbi:efflux RND transporter periplasmic adaptor subunit [Rhodoferax sp.]|uniref:efflux RND transporter periplasmic adaptor subunit n=1 Tax=Rhodoferax sp. TaxID=50421 RepID=UPI002627E8D0|nr:efflux RND transporter periplasmic adaptor subunit [Rhodoferax sp.]MDD2924286.1 efflux RND transporter periplasmic adaptor subunit [Rhodoferax sp.]